MSDERGVTNLLQAAQADMFLGMVRIYLGLGLFIKAMYFQANQDYLMQVMEDAGDLWLAPALVLHYVIPAHALGGLMLMLGLLTRIAALAQLPVLAGAVFWLYAPQFQVVEIRENLEFAALVLFLLALICVFGGGRWALDNKLFKSREHTHEPARASA